MILEALLFDMDGTLTDTDHVHRVAWQEVLARHGVMIDQSIYDTRITGRMNPNIVQDFLPELADDFIPDIVNEKEAIAVTLMQHLEPVAGLYEILAWRAQENLKLALVTNATHATVPFVLQALGLTNTFKIRVLAEDVKAGKPDPIHYQTALERLGVPADRAIAFEDTPSGVHSAAGAGIKVVGLTTSQPAQRLLDAGASLVIQDFTDETLWQLLKNSEHR